MPEHYARTIAVCTLAHVPHGRFLAPRLFVYMDSEDATALQLPRALQRLVCLPPTQAPTYLSPPYCHALEPRSSPRPRSRRATVSRPGPGSASGPAPPPRPPRPPRPPDPACAAMARPGRTRGGLATAARHAAAAAGAAAAAEGDVTASVTLAELDGGCLVPLLRPTGLSLIPT